MLGTYACELLDLQCRSSANSRHKNTPSIGGTETTTYAQAHTHRRHTAVTVLQYTAFLPAHASASQAHKENVSVDKRIGKIVSSEACPLTVSVSPSALLALLGLLALLFRTKGACRQVRSGQRATATDETALTTLPSFRSRLIQTVLSATPP